MTKVKDLDQTVVGKKIKVTGVAPSVAEEMGNVNDTTVLMGQTGLALSLSGEQQYAQLTVAWDHREPGSLALCGEDAVVVLTERSSK